MKEVRTYYCSGVSLVLRILTKGISHEQGTADGRASAMGQLIKENVEAPASAESRAQNKPNLQRKPPATRLRADAVSLEVAVKVHGSRPVAPSSGATPHTERFEEQTSTMIVFAKGGVLRMNTPVASGQMLVVTNLKSRQDAICRVLNVRSFPNMQSYVEVEFTQPQPGYWGVQFAAEIPSPAQGISSWPSIAPEKETNLDRPPEVNEPPQLLRKTQSSRPATPSESPQKPVSSASSYARPGSPFVSIGTKEEVQPAAAATSIDRSPRAVPELQDSPRNDTRKRPTLEASTEDASSENRLIAHSQETPADLEEFDRAIRAFGSVETPPAPSANRPVAAESFGIRLVREEERTPSTGSRRNRLLIAACVGIVFAAVTGGVWYFRHPAVAVRTEQGIEAKPAPAVVQAPIVSNSTPPVARSEPMASALARQPSPVGSSKPPAEKPGLVPPVEGKPKQEPRPQTESHVTSDDRAAAPKVEEASSAKPAASPTAQPSDQASGPALEPQAGGHPLWSQRAVDAAQVPSVEAGAQNGPGELPGIGPSGVAVPPPPVDGPVRVGGKVKEPQVISAPMPAYPILAKQAHVEGDVVIETEIDKNGVVARMKVISGPLALRQAALDALRKWKYKPSQLDGQAVAVDMLVTIKFRL
jgi:TonB family protein